MGNKQPKRKTWSNLTQEEKNWVASVYQKEAKHKEKCQEVSKRYGGITHQTVRNWWQRLGITVPDYRMPSDLSHAKKNKINDNTDILLVTSAQNKTSVNSRMLRNMEVYAQHIRDTFGKKVQIVVCPTRYKNPTSLTENKDNEDWWDKSITDYLFYDNIYFGDTIISALSRVQPTARVPLTGLEAMSDGKNFVLGHPKYQMKVIPRFSDEDVHIMTTSGSLTFKNYSDSRSGENGEIHHVYGFTIIEKSEEDSSKCLVPRFVNCTSDGDFIDLTHNLERGVHTPNYSCEALVMGDIHSRKIDKSLIGATYRIFGEIVPKKIFLHDVFDGSTVNPHEDKDLYIKRRKILDDQYKVIDEVTEALNFIEDLKFNMTKSKIYVVESNHDVFLDRWINNFNWKTDLHNSDAYLRYAQIQQTVDLKPHGNVFGYIVNSYLSRDIKYIPYGHHKRVKGILCSMHGDFGVNGSKSSVSALGRLPSKSYTGHLHSHAVFNGAYVVGVSCEMEQYYNRKGLSTWSQGHGVVYENGKRQQIIFTKDYKLSNLINKNYRI